MSGSIENSTRRGYMSGLRKFHAFISQTDVGVTAPPCGTSSELRALICQVGVIESFICFCFKDNLAKETTDLYIDALRFFATDLNGVPFFEHEPVIRRLMDGYQKLGKASAPPALGIDAILLRSLVQHVDTMNLGQDSRLWKAMFIVAFFGCFRVSEFLVSNDALKLLTFNGVRLVAGGAMEFSLNKTKNNSRGNRRPQQVLFGPLPGDIICPVMALRLFAASRYRSKGDVAFFIDSTGKMVTPDRFNTMLRKALQGMGVLDHMRYSSKSFRIGAASMCYSLNMSNEEIQALGRWASLAFLYYVRSGARALRGVIIQKRLAAAR